MCCLLEVCHDSHECFLVLPEILEVEPFSYHLSKYQIDFSQALSSSCSSPVLEIIRMILALPPGQGQ